MIVGAIDPRSMAAVPLREGVREVLDALLGPPCSQRLAMLEYQMLTAMALVSDLANAMRVFSMVMNSDQLPGERVQIPADARIH